MTSPSTDRTEAAFPRGIPPGFSTEDELIRALTEPSPALVNLIPRIAGPLMILGGGGKMGPTLAVLAKRAAEVANVPLEVIAVSRFTNQSVRSWLEAHRVRTIAADLLDAKEVAALPDAPNAVYLVGLKFGTTDDPAATWAINTIVPVRVCDRFPNTRFAALSTGNVYPFSPVRLGGATESNSLTPGGEYPNAAVARERLFQFLSQQNHTPVALLRLFYAVEVRYGVLVDIALRVFRDEPIPLANGHVNCIWQGDANDMILRALTLADAPATVWNLCRPEVVAVRDVAERFGAILGRSPRFEGTPAETALLGNSERLCEQLGTPPTRVEWMIEWIAHWIARGGRNLDRPTHFEVRDGQY